MKSLQSEFRDPAVVEEQEKAAAELGISRARHTEIAIREKLEREEDVRRSRFGMSDHEFRALWSEAREIAKAKNPNPG